MVFSRKVLLLNASYEALGTVPVARAVCLVWKRTAETVERDGDCVLRSQHFAFEVPSVIRLVEYLDVRRRRQHAGKQRVRVLMRDKFVANTAASAARRSTSRLTTFTRVRAAGAASRKICAPPAYAATSARATARRMKRVCRFWRVHRRCATG
jgi:hypothetical protein